MIETSPRDFIFKDIYGFAALVEACAQNVSSFIELGLEDNPDVALRLQKPRKISLLHEYIFAMIRTEETRDYRKNRELYEKEESERLKGVFEEYGIRLDSFPSEQSFSNENASFYAWFLINESSFLEYWERAAEEVFHILFANRRFLLQFSQTLAEYISEIHSHLPSTLLSDQGKIKRLSPIPSWVKKAVFYRDCGRCVFCRKDLSGRLSTDRTLSYDHIVPLARWGSNDPSNFQLLCEDCNSKKSASPGRAGRSYSAWW
jgi:HNH endonuclease